MLIEIYYIFFVFFSTAQHTAFANVPNHGSFADRPVDSLGAADQAMMCYLLEVIVISECIVVFGYTGHGKVIPSVLGKWMWFGHAAQVGLLPCLHSNAVQLGRTPENLVEIVPEAWPLDASQRNPLQSSDRCQTLTYGEVFAAVNGVFHCICSL